jgi:hypothetical protein
VTVRLDRDYKIDLIWIDPAQSGYIAAFFNRSDHWKMSDSCHPRSALDAAWSTGWETGPAPWPTAIARALIRAGLAEAV